METKHQIIISAAQQMTELADNSIELIVTSPPYPMIQMWDDIMANQNIAIQSALDENKGLLAFELMHKELDKVWAECSRVLVNGGFACINIGDATRTIDGKFALYPNHSRIIQSFQRFNLSNLPNILWRKQTNAPNKFMGSGMLPAGAYVTLEHEWILVFRKGGKRQFKNSEEKLRRQQSSFFWEERNIWFSDLWDLKGTKQALDKSKTRERSAAYPFELPYRLINMYSLQGDMVLDPFLGTGTTTLAAIACQRNSIGYEIDPQFLEIIIDNLENTSINYLNTYTQNRIENHRQFILERTADTSKKPIKHYNRNMETPVMTSQEKNIQLSFVERLERKENVFIANYNKVRTFDMQLLEHKQIVKQTSLF